MATNSQDLDDFVKRSYRHGFVTEYAGAPNVVSQRGIFANGWDAGPFNGIAPELGRSEALHGQNRMQGRR